MNIIYGILLSLLLPFSLEGKNANEKPAFGPETKQRCCIVAGTVTGSPDTLIRLGIPYFHFQQVYDSCYVECIFGEFTIGRADGSREELRPYYFRVGPSPTAKGFDSYENLRDSSRTRYVTLHPFDTLWYYKSVRVTQIYTSTEFLGESDTLLFITQVLDGATGEILANLDTAGVIVADSIVNIEFYIDEKYPGPGNLYYFTPTPGVTLDSVALTMWIEFRKGPDSDDILCRLDIYSPDRLSARDAYHSIFLQALRDSIIASGLGKAMQGFVPPPTFSFTAWPNPAHDATLTLEFVSVYSANVIFHLFDMNGSLRQSTSARYVHGGVKAASTVSLTQLPSGRYVVVPVVDGIIGQGKEIVIIK
jgi:hypothetical protein